jgi:hypothetical protein
MPDETPHRSAEIRDARGSDEGGAGAESPLQTRAAFLANWNWQSVIGHNRGMCARGGAQHGANSESQAGVAADWDARFQVETTLGDTLDFLRSCHRRAPFLFFNGNTFADIGRTFSDFLFAELPTNRRRQATSAVAHYIAGVLDRDAMVAIVESLCRSASLQPGDRVRTLRGSLRGVITRVLDDGRVAVRPDGAASEMISLPENLLPEEAR